MLFYTVYLFLFIKLFFYLTVTSYTDKTFKKIKNTHILQRHRYYRRSIGRVGNRNNIILLLFKRKWRPKRQKPTSYSGDLCLMATRNFARTLPDRLTTSLPLMKKSTVDETSPLILILGLHGFKPRWASSSSLFDSSETASAEKICDRLSGVIEAVNDRKLPPEIRGQRNAVRYITTLLLHTNFQLPSVCLLGKL